MDRYRAQENMWPSASSATDSLEAFGVSLHGDAVFLGILHVDVVDADAAADDELQLAALGLIDVVRADLGLRADDDRVKLAQRRAQLIRLVELLDDLMPQLAELCHGLLVHSIGNENTHTIISLYNRCGTRRDKTAAPCWVVTCYSSPRSPSGTSRAPRRLPSAWRCRWTHADRRRTCGP